MEKIINSLLEQARDKEFLACGDESSIFTEDAKYLRAAANLLKAQEPVEPKWRKGYAYCGKCEYKLHRIVDHNNFCSNCGQAVKW